jgi:hypothetical protein
MSRNVETQKIEDHELSSVMIRARGSLGVPSGIEPIARDRSAGYDDLIT